MAIIAAVQMCSSPDVDENLIHADKLLKRAAETGAKLVVLPEMFAMMGAYPVETTRVIEKLEAAKLARRFLADAAREYGIWIVGGTLPYACERDATRVRAASIVYNDHGEEIARYDKIHLFDATLSDSESYRESLNIEPGTKPIVIATPFGKIGLGVCYDIRFPELFRYLVNEGAEILVVPSAFTVNTGANHWRLLARTRAVENFCFFVGACQGGYHIGGRRTYGHSLIVDPWGEVMAAQPEGEGVLSAELNLEYLYQLRQSLPALSHQKLVGKYQFEPA